MPIAMGDQFKGLPMSDLIGGPLMAACDAQVRLANATAGFIQQIGFQPKADDPSGKNVKGPADLQVREVAFRFSRPRELSTAERDATIDTTQTAIEPPVEIVELSVPLLAIVKIPALAINTVDIVFDMEVKNTERSSQIDEARGAFSADASIGWGPFSMKVHVEGSVSSHKENTRETDQSAKYHVEVRAEDKGMPEGLARVLDMMNSAIAPRKITPQPTTSAKLAAPSDQATRGRPHESEAAHAGEHAHGGGQQGSFLAYVQPISGAPEGAPQGLGG